MAKKQTCVDCGKQFLPKYNHIERCEECEEIYRKQKLTIGQVLILREMEQKIEEQRVRDGYYPFTHTCVVCGKKFGNNRANSTVCSDKCRRKNRYAKALEKKQAQSVQAHA